MDAFVNGFQAVTNQLGREDLICQKKNCYLSDAAESSPQKIEKKDTNLTKRIR